MYGLWVRMAFPEQVTISGTGKVYVKKGCPGFTLIEVLLVLSLLLLVLTLSLAVLPGQPSGPGGTVVDVDDIVRNAMVEALASSESVVLYVSDTELFFEDSSGNRRGKEFEEGIRLIDPLDRRPLQKVWIHRDGMHSPFIVVVDEDDIATYLPTMRYR